MPSAPPPPPAPSARAPAAASVERSDLPEEDFLGDSLDEQRAAVLRRMKPLLELTDAQVEAVRKLFSGSAVIGQGIPALSQHALTRKACRAARKAAGVEDAIEPQCRAHYMVPLWNPPAGETKKDAKVCIDRYEFPGLPCEYPITGATAREAQLLCRALDKRLCDAHEWEGACAGAVRPPDRDYAFGKSRGAQRAAHNDRRDVVWAYGPKKRHDLCATAAKNTKACVRGGWRQCGTHSWPAGSFPQCRSSFGVYDQHGNVAEHMSLPLVAAELGARGGVGSTEMKGSWFIFQTFEAHDDDCRWRAPDWHGSKVMDKASHANYHLGFRCCKDVEPQAAPGKAPPPGP